MELTKKQFTYKGKTVEELKTLDVREFAKLLTSRQRRTALRNFSEIEAFIKLAKKKLEKGKSIRTHKRDLIVVPEFVGMRISIYNGHNFVPVDITAEMLGHKFGEFALTRTKASHTKSGVGATKGTKHKSKK